MLITPNEKKHIGDAVAKAEAGTSGEIVVAIIPESDNYAFRELLFALFAGLVTFFILSFFTESLADLLDSLFWNTLPAFLPLAMLFIAMAVIVLVYLLVQIPALDRLVIGRQLMATAVKRRATRHFVESATYDTVGQSGVLLFISVLERRVEIIADRGIHKMVAADTWDHVVRDLVAGIRKKQAASAIVTAIQKVGAVLAQYAPPQKGTIDELPNSPTELQKGS